MNGIAIAFAVLMLLIAAGDIVDLIPSFLLCAFKENRSIYNSSKLRRSCDRVLLFVAPAFLMVLTPYRFYPFAVAQSMPLAFLYTCLTAAAYCFLRFFLRVIFYNGSRGQDYFKGVVFVSHVFLVLGALIVCVVFGVCKLVCVEDSLVRDIIMWTMAGIYVVYLLRVFQVFCSPRGFFSAFLYLCALEIIPTGLLVASFYVDKLCQ